MNSRPRQSPVPMRIRASFTAGISVALALMAGCASPHRDLAANLPQGDPAAGKVLFSELQCHACHRVIQRTDAFPAPIASPPVPVDLGDEPSPPAREYWVTSIIDPSLEIAPGHRESLVSENGQSRMGDYSHLLSSAQLANLVAFLESLHEMPESLE